MTDKPQNKNHDEQFEEKAKERLKVRKEKAKKKRPEYKKKRVFVPVITAVILVLTGIFLAVHATFYQSTDDAFVEGRLISVAPRVSGPVINLLVDDNDVVKAGQLLVEIDPADYEVKLHQAEAKLEEAKAQLNVTEKQIEEGSSNVNQSYEDVTSALYTQNIHVPAVNYVYGIGGRDTTTKEISQVFNDLQEIVTNDFKIENPYRYLGVRI